MAKTNKIPSKVTKKQFNLLFIITGLIALLALVQAFLINDLYQRTDKLDDDKLKSLIVDAVRGISRPLVIDPQSSKEYVPEGRLVLPPSKDVSVLYEGDKDSLQFGLRSTVDQGIGDVKLAADKEAIFAKTKILQVCSRQVDVRFQPEIGDKAYQQVHTKRLADGRTAYFFANKDCKADVTPLLDYLKQAESY